MDPMTMISLGSGLLGAFGSRSAGKQSARMYENMQPQIDQWSRQQEQLTGRANNYLDPYYNAGRGEIGGYQQNYKNLMDPNFINQLMGKYQTTDYAKHQLKEGNQAITNAASASGALNSGQFGKDMSGYARDITSRDQQQYLDRMLNQYNMGLGHQGSMVGMGLGAGGQMGQNLIRQGEGSLQALLAKLRSQEQASQAKQGGDAGFMSGLTGSLGGLFGSQGGLGGLFGMNKSFT